MSSRTLMALAAATALGAAPVGSLRAQVTSSQDSASHRMWGTNPNAPAPSGAAQADVKADSAFIREALSGNRLEVRLGNLAVQKAADSAVRQFGQRMVADHTTMGNQWGQLAAQSGMALEPALDPAKEQQATRLGQLSGAEFDRAYMAAMIRNHQHDVDVFRTRGMAARSAAVRQLAASGLSTIQQHLSLATRLGSRASDSAAVAGLPPSPAPAAENRPGAVRREPAETRNGNVAADRDFIQNVAAANLMEIRLGELARQRARDPEVKRLAQRLVSDYTSFQKKWTGMASRHGMSFHPAMGRLHQEKVDRVQKARGGQFDRVYVTTVIDHFQALLPYFQKEGRAARSPQVRNLIEEELPVLRQHLAQARRIDVRDLSSKR